MKPNADSQLRIDFLYWRGCPSYEAALSLVREMIAELGVGATIFEREVTTDGDAERLRFLGSPTIQVNGRDVDPGGAADSASALTCRVYRIEDGSYSPVPSREMIRRALSA